MKKAVKKLGQIASLCAILACNPNQDANNSNQSISPHQFNLTEEQIKYQIKADTNLGTPQNPLILISPDSLAQTIELETNIATPKINNQYYDAAIILQAYTQEQAKRQLFFLDLHVLGETSSLGQTANTLNLNYFLNNSLNKFNLETGSLNDFEKYNNFITLNNQINRLYEDNFDPIEYLKTNAPHTTSKIIENLEKIKYEDIDSYATGQAYTLSGEIIIDTNLSIVSNLATTAHELGHISDLALRHSHYYNNLITAKEKPYEDHRKEYVANLYTNLVALEIQKNDPLMANALRSFLEVNNILTDTSSIHHGAKSMIANESVTNQHATIYNDLISAKHENHLDLLAEVKIRGYKNNKELALNKFFAYKKREERYKILNDIYSLDEIINQDDETFEANFKEHFGNYLDLYKAN